MNDLQEKVWIALEAQSLPVPPDGTCPHCAGMGMITLDIADVRDPLFGKAFRCICERETAIKRVWGNAGLPKRRMRCSFEIFDAMPAAMQRGKTDARHFAGRMAAGEAMFKDGEEKNSLIFSGAPGIGKSGLMACIAQSRLNSSEDVLWVDANDFLLALFKAYDASKVSNEQARDKDRDAVASASDILDRMQRAYLLCLDDLGDMEHTGGVTEHTRNKVYDVLHYRYDEELPTIITTNLNLSEIKTQFGQRIADRIWEMGHWLHMTGASLRFGE